MTRRRKPAVNPVVLVIVIGWAGVLALFASQFVAPEYSGQVLAFGAYLLGWATKQPGQLSVTTHPDDVP